jgi:uncharacterized protein (DUF2236 family)
MTARTRWPQRPAWAAWAAWPDRRLGLPSPEPGTPGDPGLFGPGSAVWTIGRERVLLLAGPAALLLQVAHPLVAAGVAAHSDFRRDPFQRLRATLGAVLAISFGDRHQAERAARRVRTVHARIRATLAEPAGPYPAGASYDATDPTLAMWVHATLVTSALDGFAAFVRPAREVERAAYVEESKRFAALFGVAEDVMPSDLAGFDRYVAEQVEGLWVGPAARGLAEDILGPPVPAALRPSLPVVRVATTGLLPEPLRRAYGLRWGPAERTAFAAVRRSISSTLPVWPGRLRFWPHYRSALARLSPQVGRAEGPASLPRARG